MPDLVELIGRAIVDEPPLAIKEGGVIRDGFSTELDELRTAQRGGKDWIAKLNQSVFPGLQGGPLMHVVAAKAIGFGEALRPEFKGYAAQIVANARTLAHELTTAGFRLVSGGTDTHLLLVDVASRGLSGKVAEKAPQCRQPDHDEQPSIVLYQVQKAFFGLMMRCNATVRAIRHQLQKALFGTVRKLGRRLGLNSRGAISQ